MDSLEFAKAEAEYGAALREFRILRDQLRQSNRDPELQRLLGEVEDRVSRAAARLAILKPQG